MATAEPLWTVLLFAVLVQGLFVAAIAFSGRADRARAGGPLAALSLVLALMVAEELVDAANLYGRLPQALLASFPLPLAIGPLLWLCARRFADPARDFCRRDALHFVPMVAVAALLLPFYLQDGATRWQALNAGLDGWLAPLVLFKGVHVLGYQAMAIVLCTRVLASGSTPNRARLRWLRRVLLVTFAPILWVHLLFFFPQLGPLESDRLGSLVVALVIYWFAWVALREPTRPMAPGDGPGASARATPAPPKYRTSALDAARKGKIRDDLLAYMRAEQPFREPEVSLADVAAALGCSAHDLSQVLNEVLGTNFHRFVNGYRIAYVKRRLAGADAARVALLELAFDAGFNSKTSFNRVFKAHTGLTPSEYRRRPRARGIALAQPGGDAPGLPGER